MRNVTTDMLALLKSLGEDVKILARQQARLARDELQLEASRLKNVVMLLVGAGIVGVLACVLLMFTLATALHELAGLPLWASFGTVTILLLLSGLGIGLMLKAQLERVHLFPIRTIQTLKEDAQWIKEQVVSQKT